MWLRLAKKLGFSVTVAKFYLRLGLCFMFCHDVNSANSPGKICWKYIYIYILFLFLAIACWGVGTLPYNSVCIQLIKVINVNYNYFI